MTSPQKNKSLFVYMASHKFWEGLFDTVDTRFIRHLVKHQVLRHSDILMTVIVPGNATEEAVAQLYEKESKLAGNLGEQGVRIEFLHIHGRTLKGLVVAAKEITTVTGKYQSRFIWARNYFNCLVGVFIKKRNPEILLHFDMLGLVPEEELYYSDSILLTRVIRFLVLRVIEKINLSKADSISVVSKRFKEHILSRYHPDTRMVEVLPCYYHEDQFFVDDALREIYRREYQINGAQKLILYSGMLQKWQEPDLLFSFVKAIQEQDINNEARFLFLTFDRGTVQQFIGKYDLHNIIVASAIDEQLNGFYNAADIGIAFRTNDMVSYVSSPVKIPEYLAAGNSVLLLEYIGDFGQELSDKGYALVKKDKNALLSTTLPELMKLTRPGSQDLVDIRENYNIHNNIEAITRIIKRMHEA